MTKSSADPRERAGWTALAFCAPLLTLMVFFVGLPVTRLIYYSFTRYDGLTAPEWIGLGNYRFLVEWPDFSRVLLNNVFLVLGIVVWVVVPFVVSIAIFSLRRADLLRTLLFVPALLPPIIVGGVFRIFLADNGVLNETTRSVGLGALALPWLSDDKMVLITIVIVIAWATLGTGVLLYSAALSAMSPSYVEAAVVEGASWVKLVQYVYWPALRGVTAFWLLLLTVTTVTGFFPWIYGLTRGGPGAASTTLDFAVFLSLSQGNLGRGSALGVISIVFVAIVVGAQLALRRGAGHSNEGMVQ